MEIAIGIPLLLLLCPAILLLFVRGVGRARASARLPPGPFAWPVIGNLMDIKWKQAHISLAKLARPYGHLMSLKFGSKVVIVASTPEAAREIFKVHDRDLSGRYVPQQCTQLPKLETSIMGLATECNERWRSLRNLAHTALFSNKALESYSRIRVEKAKEMLKFLGSKEVRGEVVNISDVLLGTIANTLTNVMVSQDMVECLDNVGEMKKKTIKMLETVMLGLADLYPDIPGLGYLWNKRKAAEADQIYRATWGDIVSKRRRRRRGSETAPQFQQQQSNKDLLDVLIECSFEDCEIYNFFTELFPTTDAVSSVVESAMVELTRNPEAFIMLRQEIMAEPEPSSAALSERRLRELPYLQACIKEALRLHPPDPILVPRCALQTCEIMNYRIPKGSLLIVNGYALGRDERSWEDALRFKPERFLTGNGDDVDVMMKGDHFEFLPFGGGRRVCPGYSFALAEIQLLLASLVYAFDWLLPVGMDLTSLDESAKLVSITLKREEPLLLIPKIKNQDWDEALAA